MVLERPRLGQAEKNSKIICSKRFQNYFTHPRASRDFFYFFPFVQHGNRLNFNIKVEKKKE
jgi:hypothetical protein